VHWGGTNKRAKPLDSIAGRAWGFSWPLDQNDLRELAFGCQSVVGASERALESIPKTHDICVEYLKQHDEKCAKFLQEIGSHLPMTIGTREYEQVTQKRRDLVR
jgi:hypothetical protein